MNLPFLDIEKRTGVKNEEIDDFLSKVNAVDDAIKQLKEGKLDPNTEIKIPGILTESEKRQAEEEARQKEDARKKREEARRIQLKEEEKEKWWTGAEVMFGPRLDRSQQQEGGDAVKGEEQKKDLNAQQKAQRLALAQQYTSDYSKWNEWTPSDPATKEEETERQLEKEKVDNEAFEKTNAEFCKQFMEDLAVREEARQKKEDGANISRLRGNRYFKAGQYDKALEYYYESLKASPFKVETLVNMVQAYLKQKKSEDALEFADRAVHLNSNHVKALCRRAVALKALGQTDYAIKDLKKALAEDPENVDVSKQLKELRQEVDDRIAEEEVARLKVKGGEQAELFSKPEELAKLMAGGPDAVMEQRGAEAIEAVGLVTMDKIMADVKAGKEEALPALAALLLASSKQAVYLRTSGMLAWLCTQVTSAVEKQSQNKNSSVSATASALSKPSPEYEVRLLSVLGAAVADEARNRSVLMQEGIFPLILARDYLGRWAEWRKAKGTKLEKDIVIRALQVMKSCCLTEECLEALAASVDSLHDLISSLADLDFEGVGMVAGLLRDVLLTHVGKRTVCQTKEKGCSPVQSIAQQLLQRPSNKNEVIKACRESLTGALANLALVQDLRSHFVGEANRALLAVCDGKEDSAASWAFAVAAMMNACLEKNGKDKVKEDLIKQGALERATSLLAANASLRERLGPQIWIRSAGLLSRLMGCSLGRARLESSGQALAVAQAITRSDIPGNEKEHLVRTLASVVTEGNASSLLSPALVKALVLMLPTPRADPIEGVTAETVSLPPKEKVQDGLAASVTKCLIPVVSGAEERQPLSLALKEVGGIERLVCLLANAQDGPVRKNVAIVLARLVKEGDVKAAQRIRELRGMEMMIQLGNRLV